MEGCRRSVMEKVILSVNGMKCNNCANTVINAVKNINGVEQVEVDLSAKTVSLTYDKSKVKLKTVAKTIKDQGYSVIK